MSGTIDLNVLLSNMQPRIDVGEFVFVSMEGSEYGAACELSPIAACVEDEGLTLVVSKERADEAELLYAGVFKRIILQVHSSLQAVGLTAAVSAALASRQISVNVVAGFYHDHLFVPASRAEEAMQTLTAMSKGAAEEILHTRSGRS